jgi:spore maturation protein CgeB
MRIVIFTHSLVSDWNHGNAHFLRGLATELADRGCEVRILEPADGWSRSNLLAEYGQAAITGFEEAYPQIRSTLYDLASLDLTTELDNADVVLVQEWNHPELIARVGRHKAAHGGYRLFFHDTHHRSLTDPEAMARLDLRGYDGVLAYGEVIRRRYVANGWARRAWTFHEAADTRVFRPLPGAQPLGDVVWIGNWGDGERTEELREFLIEPVRSLGIKARVYGVRYPPYALQELSAAGIEYGGWLPNYLVPEVFARYKVTLHIPRRPYAEILHGIPTIRPFEAMACGIPMVSTPWRDTEKLFSPGANFLIASSGVEMKSALRALLSSSTFADSVAASALALIRARHTCAHRAEQLLGIVNEEVDRLAAEYVL